MFLSGEVVGKVRQKMNISQDPRERREAQGKADIVKQGFKIYD